MVKGASGVIECHFIEGFMHKVENVLDRLRNSEIRVSSDLTGLLLRCCDHLGRLMDVLEAGQPTPADDVNASGEALQLELTTYTGGTRPGRRWQVSSKAPRNFTPPAAAW